MSAREVELTGGSPWGFRMHGGADQHQPLRISRVNPGRKAALSGIREGDVITSINGRPTRSMSNAEAHAMLRSAGPVLRLGLNEDKEHSPRRRSLGKSGGLELKRPSQLIAEMQSGRATPQPPVYATTRTSQSPLRTSSSPFRSPLNCAPAALSSTPLVKSATSEEPMRFHPTNPFYSTMPSNNTSASKLPVPNGKTLFASLDRSSKPNKSTPRFAADSELFSQSQTNFYNSSDSGPSSVPYDSRPFYSSAHNGSTDSFQEAYRTQSNGGPFSTSNGYQGSHDSIDYTSNINGRDPFEKYLNAHRNGELSEPKVATQKSSFESEDGVVTRRSTVTEHKVSECEEIKTVKKIIMNGANGETSEERDRSVGDSSLSAERPPPPPPVAPAVDVVGVTTKPPLKSPPALAPVPAPAHAHAAVKLSVSATSERLRRRTRNAHRASCRRLRRAARPGQVCAESRSKRDATACRPPARRHRPLEHSARTRTYHST